MEIFDDSRELLRAIMRPVIVTCNSDAAFCYIGSRDDAKGMPGVLAVGDEFCTLPARPALQVLGDAPSSDWLTVVRGGQCPKLFARLPGAEHFVHSYVLYARLPDQSPCVCGMRYDPTVRLHDSLPAVLMQLAPVLGAAVSATIGLRHGSSPSSLERWARLVSALYEACLIVAAQTNKARSAFDPTPAPATADGRQLPKLLRGPAAGGSELSNRECQIGNLLAAGYAAVNAAAVLGISEHTVRTYIRRLYRKLGVTNRADFVRRYIAVVGADAVTTGVFDSAERKSLVERQL